MTEYRNQARLVREAREVAERDEEGLRRLAQDIVKMGLAPDAKAAYKRLKEERRHVR